MILTKTIVINGVEFNHTRSDIGVKIERDGVRYNDAVDPKYLGYTYIETDEPIKGWEPMKYSARSILRELRELGKYEAFRQLLTSIGYDWEFLSANYLADDDADFKRLKSAVVDAGIVGSMEELDAMLAKCVWAAE